MIGVGTKCKNCRKIIDDGQEFCSDNCSINYNFPTEEIDGCVYERDAKPINEKSEVEQFLKGKDFAFITGKAGSGKTYAIRQIAEKNPKVLLCATTGIAAINLDSTTLHSRLGFFNLKSLEDAYARGFLQTKLHKLAEKYDTAIVDEASMLCAAILDIITSGISEMIIPFNFYLCGDVCQLPPVTSKDEAKAEYITKAQNWDLFEKNTLKLEKIWRQDNPEFIAAINAMRESNGQKALELLKSCGVEFRPRLQESFDGTTIIAVNKLVDDFNKKELAKLTTDMIRVSPTRRGRQKSEWDSQIPVEMRFKVGAYIMILSNDTENWEYANGDCGTILRYNKFDDSFDVELKRNGKVVPIRRITRKFLTDKEPSQAEFNSMYIPTIDHLTKDWIIGEISYHPLRLAYASTVHKSQGLSLDKVQLDITHSFFAYPSMLYTGVSRARTPEGLIIVGNEKDFVRKCIIAKEVQRWV